MDSDVTLLARIIEHTPIGIVILTPERNIRYVNLRAANMFERHRDALLGVAMDDFVNDLPGETRWKELWPSVGDGNVHEVNIGLSRQEGEEVICAVTAFYLGGKEDQQDAVALILRDITHERKIDEQLENKNIEMAKMNTELIRSNIELKRLSEMKTNFLSITSHELKTPLTSIMGYSDIIVDNMKERLDEGVFRMVESINRAAGRLNKVINNILDVTRIDQKKLRLKPETFQLAGAVNDCIEELAQLAAQRGISFKCFFTDNLPEFYGDRSRMQQVFANLFTNAIKFSPDGSVVEVSLAAEGCDRFHITIRDHGIGIDANDQRHIFDPFSEIGELSKHSTDQMKFKGGGAGLGLSIAKGIVEQHGGRIWVESPGVGVRAGAFPGSAFHIILPVRSEIGRDDLEKEPVVPAVSAVTMPKREIKEGKPSLLLIDTDHEAVEVARMVLENAFAIITAPTGEMGLSLAFRHKPSMILLDVSLPGLDGFRVCSILRTQEETRKTPVVFLSSTTRKEEIEKCFACGADDFIVKPFSGRELMDRIWQLLMKKKAEAVP